VKSLNALHGNGADKLLEKYVLLTRDKFKQDLVAVFMGIAYGGDVEMCARHWKGCGEVYGYDTFEDGHPRYLAKDPDSFEATCMDLSYSIWGFEELAYKFQRAELDRQQLFNAHLVKGLVEPDSCANLNPIHLVWLDMDLNCSMRNGFLATASRIPKGGYLTLHDVVPRGHIPHNWELFYQELLDRSEWEEVESVRKSYFCAWMKK
jgi:hypothetical protein